MAERKRRMPEPFQVDLEPPEKQPSGVIRLQCIGGVWDGHTVDTHPRQPATRFLVHVPQEVNEVRPYGSLGPGEFVHGPKPPSMVQYRQEEYRLAEYHQPLTDGYARRYCYMPAAKWGGGNSYQRVPSFIRETPTPTGDDDG